MTICELSTSGTTTLTQGTWEQCDIVRQEESGVHVTLMSPTAALIALTDVGDDPRSQGWCIHGTLSDPRTQGCVWRCIHGTLSSQWPRDPGMWVMYSCPGLAVYCPPWDTMRHLPGILIWAPGIWVPLSRSFSRTVFWKVKLFDRQTKRIVKTKSMRLNVSIHGPAIPVCTLPNICVKWDVKLTYILTFLDAL